MKKHVLVLVTLLALIPFAQLMAQEPPATPSPAQGLEAPVPDGGQCLATPSDGQAEVPSDPATTRLFTSCTNNSECQTGELCCNLCGALPDDETSCMFCILPVRKRCPLVV